MAEQFAFGKTFGSLSVANSINTGIIKPFLGRIF